MDTSTKPVIAAFDFDKTLTHSDTFVPFLRYAVGLPRFLCYGALLLPDLIKTALGWQDRSATKEKVLTLFFKGVLLSDLRVSCKNYVQDVVPSMLSKDAMRRLKWHQEQGHRCLLVSATLSDYVSLWATSVGFEETIASELETSSTGQITGKLIQGNCYGPEKIRRLLERCGPKEHFILYAYGDSRGDKELLEAADHPYYQTMP